MKWITIICSALFPFLHMNEYPAELVSCEKDKIILNAEGSDMIVSLFNMKIISDEGWSQTCSMLQNAETISFEIDASSKVVEPVQVYLFADEQLIQEELIRTQQGYSIIHNPEYKYQVGLDEMESSQETMTTSDPEVASKHYLSFGFLYFISFLCGWLCLYYYLFHKKNREKANEEIDETNIRG